MSKPHPLTGAVPLSVEEARKLLSRVLDAAHQASASGVIAFDLDSTLLDNKPRQSRILNEYGSQVGISALVESGPHHWAGWDARIAMRNAGLSHEDAESHAGPFKEFWWSRFFTSDYCRIDVPVAGAPTFVNALHSETRVKILYLTGRHEDMRAGTEYSFETGGFPMPDGDRVQLWMKPNLDEHDDAYKDRSMSELKDLGRLVAAFDNEPTHINTYRAAFPEAHSVHLATDSSLREIKVDKEIPSISDFTPFSV